MGDATAACRVVLIGMMGSGKSTIGRELAQITGWPYHDNDALFEMLRGETAKDLLAHEGVAELRQTEAYALLLGLRQPMPCIVSAPAGTILDDEIRDLLKREAFVVWLAAVPKTLARRARAGGHRPWLDGDAEAWMTTALAARTALYEDAANVTISTERTRPHRVAQQIANLLPERCRWQ